MRVGFIRSDLGRVYLSDLENTSQRNFSSEPPGQSRYVSRPSDDKLSDALVDGGYVVNARGTNNAATKDTNPANALLIRVVPTGQFTSITVTAGDTQPVATVVSDLNSAFSAASLPLEASFVSTGMVQIQSTVKGSNSYIGINPTGSTLAPILGFPTGMVVAGLTPTDLRNAVVPSGTSINVSPGNIGGLSSSPGYTGALITNLPTGTQLSIIGAVQEAVAPRVIDTGRALLSFDRGVLADLRDSSFQPGGARSGVAAGAAVVVVEDDGVTPKTI